VKAGRGGRFALHRCARFARAWRGIQSGGNEDGLDFQPAMLDDLIMTEDNPHALPRFRYHHDTAQRAFGGMIR
jgi:hypothetical protein